MVRKSVKVVDNGEKDGFPSVSQEPIHQISQIQDESIL